MSPQERAEAFRAAITRLVQIAQGDTHQSGRVADFLLAWWNAGECGGFDLTSLWSLDTEIAVDMVTVFACLAGTRQYPDSLGFAPQFEKIVAAWRPKLLKRKRRRG